VADTTIPENVFLDTEVFVSASFNFATKSFVALKEHLDSGRLKLILVDTTVAEIKARIKKHVEAEVAELKKAQKGARVLRSSLHPGAVAISTKPDAVAIAAEVTTRFEGLVIGAEILLAHDVDAEPVFKRYFANEPPFSTGDKKNEFPDAFAAQALEEWVDDNERELFVVTNDQPLFEALGSVHGIHAKRTLGELLDHVASDNAALAEFLRAYFSNPPEVVKSKVLKEFENLTFYVKDEDGEGSVTAESAELVGQPALVSVDTESRTAVVQMVFRVRYHGHIAYRDSSSGIWDSEDDTLFYQDDIEEEILGRQTKVTVEVTAMFDGLDPNAVDEEETSIVKPADGVYFIPTNESLDNYK
jgi:hypothetical protein